MFKWGLWEFGDDLFRKRPEEDICSIFKLLILFILEKFIGCSIQSWMWFFVLIDNIEKLRVTLPLKELGALVVWEETKS